MTLIEAAKTGKPYRRTKDVSWREPHHAHVFAADDILADDYVIKPGSEFLPVTPRDLNYVYDLGVARRSQEFGDFLVALRSRSHA